MEAALPFASLKREKHLAATVKIAIPLRIFLVLEMSPHIVVEFQEPLKAFLVTGELIAFDHRDGTLQMNPPELLVPLQFLGRIALAVHKIEDSAVLLIPTVFYYTKRYLHSLVYELAVISPDTYVHKEPHRLQVVSGVHLTAFETVHQFSFRRKVLHNHSQIRLIEHIHYLVHAFVYGLVDKGRIVNDILNFESHIADNHRQGEILHRASPRIGLVPLSLRICPTRQNALESLLRDLSVFLASCSLGQLGESHTSESVREDIIWLNDRLAFPGNRKVEIIITVVPVFL